MRAGELLRADPRHANRARDETHGGRRGLKLIRGNLMKRREIVFRFQADVRSQGEGRRAPRTRTRSRRQPPLSRSLISNVALAGVD